MSGAATEGLTVLGVSLARGRRRVLDGVGFDVRPGEIVALIGPNGAGKTTLLECITGLRRPDSGTLSHNGRALRTLDDFAAVFAFMPDDAVPPPEVGVAALLAHATRYGRTPAALASELVEHLGLHALLGARAGELSRGERRRVALFLALCAARPVLVLDEPFGAFDPRQLIEVLAVVRARAVAGHALVVSVHQMSDAEKLADRVLLLCAGRVLAFGTLAELRSRAQMPDAALEAVFLEFLGAPEADARA